MSANDMTVAICVIFTLFTIYRDWQMGKERERLMDRVMATSLPQLNYETRKKVVQGRPPAAKAATDEEMSAREERMREEQIAHANGEIDDAVLKAKAFAHIHGSGPRKT